jgi:hypothetical protein
MAVAAVLVVVLVAAASSEDLAVVAAVVPVHARMFMRSLRKRDRCTPSQLAQQALAGLVAL